MKYISLVLVTLFSLNCFAGSNCEEIKDLYEKYKKQFEIAIGVTSAVGIGGTIAGTIFGGPLGGGAGGLVAIIPAAKASELQDLMEGAERGYKRCIKREQEKTQMINDEKEYYNEHLPKLFAMEEAFINKIDNEYETEYKKIIDEYASEGYCLDCAEGEYYKAKIRLEINIKRKKHVESIRASYDKMARKMADNLFIRTSSISAGD